MRIGIFHSSACALFFAAVASACSAADDPGVTNDTDAGDGAFDDAASRDGSVGKDSGSSEGADATKDGGAKKDADLESGTQTGSVTFSGTAVTLADTCPDHDVSVCSYSTMQPLTNFLSSSRSNTK